MPAPLRTAFYWAPRLTGVAVALFVGLFALDAFDGRPVLQVLPDFGLHLVPAAIVAIVTAVAWRHEWVGVVSFLALAVAYAVSVPMRPDWIAVISGPLVVTAVLFLLSLMQRRRQAKRVSAS